MNSPTNPRRWPAARGLAASLALVLGIGTWEAQAQGTGTGKTFEEHVGHGRVNIVDFRASTGPAGPPLVFRLEFMTFERGPSDGFLGPITRGKMTFSYPRQNNPAVAYRQTATEAARFTQGPPYGDTVDYQARELAPNVFEVHWKEPRRGDTVTQIDDFNRQQVCTNITNLNRVPIPAQFDPLDMTRQLDNPTLFPSGNPVARADFPFFSLCGQMRQSLATDKVWENELHMLVYKAPQ